MSGYQSYGYQGPPQAGSQSRPYIVDEEWEDSYTPYEGGGYSNTSAFQAPHNQSSDQSRRRQNPTLFENELYADEPAYEEADDTPESPSAIEERHYSTSAISPKSVRFAAGEDSSNNYNTLPPHARPNIINDPIKRRQDTQGGRSSISSIASETYRRASQAAEAVTNNIGWAARLWAWWVQEFGPGFLALCAVIFGVGYAVHHALEFPTGGSAIFFWAASETGQDIADAWNQGKRAQALKQRVDFNLTRHFKVGGVGGGVLTSFETGPWALYGDLLRDAEMGRWFDEARRVDDVVTALWAGLPPLEGVVVTSAGDGSDQQPQPITVTVTFPGGRKERPGGWRNGTKDNNNITTEKMTTGSEDDGKDQEQEENAKAVRQRLAMRSSMDMRSTMRKRAEAYFENFLAGRPVIVNRALDGARRFGELVETHLVAPVDVGEGGDDKSTQELKTVGPEFHADVAAKFGLESGKQGVMSWKKEFPEVTVKNRTNYILSYAGLHLTNKLLEAHQLLYAAGRPEPDDFPADLKGQASSLLATSKPDKFSVLTDLRRAEEAERKFLTDLIAQSAYGKVIATKKELPLKLGWTKQPATLALDTLIGKAQELQGRLQSAGRNLAWLNERLAAQVAAETGAKFQPAASTAGGPSGAPTEVKDEDRKYLLYGNWSWSQTAGEMVDSWGRDVALLAGAVRFAEQLARSTAQDRKGDWWEGRTEEDKRAAVQKWRVDSCARASCYGDIAPAAIGDKKGEEKKKSWIGWFFGNKKNGARKEKAEEVKAEGDAQTGKKQQKPLSGSGSGDGGEATTTCCDDGSLAGKAACEHLCCGYSMHNEWADLLLYGDKDFIFQDLYTGFWGKSPGL